MVPNPSPQTWISVPSVSLKCPTTLNISTWKSQEHLMAHFKQCPLGPCTSTTELLQSDSETSVSPLALPLPHSTAPSATEPQLFSSVPLKHTHFLPSTLSLTLPIEVTTLSPWVQPEFLWQGSVTEEVKEAKHLPYTDLGHVPKVKPDTSPNATQTCHGPSLGNSANFIPFLP